MKSLVLSGFLPFCMAAALGCNAAGGGSGGATSTGTRSASEGGAGGSGGAGAGTGGSSTASTGTGISTAPLDLVIEPSDDADALLAAVQGAKSSVHMTMYLLSDSRFVNALIAQHQAGHDVKVVLNQTFPTPGTDNSAVFNQLKSAGVSVAWAPSTFTLTHEKCVIIDGKVAWIMTMNLSFTSPTKNREILAADSTPEDVAEAEAVFDADFHHQTWTPSGSLLVAPVNAQSPMVAALSAAKSTIDLEGEELSDTKIASALIAASKAGVSVRVVLANTTPTPAQSNAVASLKAANVKLVSLGSPYVHVKTFVVDGKVAYLGSENFTKSSLLDNRELGLLTADPVSVGRIATTIDGDFAAGSPL
jgi:phosphatidylserine/phosphatidylglycerophosphate/cardiolipin synthase-like enzyme